jgi:hypothetical protein
MTFFEPRIHIFIAYIRFIIHDSKEQIEIVN